jgi:hypothetical protein
MTTLKLLLQVAARPKLKTAYYKRYRPEKIVGRRQEAGGKDTNQQLTGDKEKTSLLFVLLPPAPVSCLLAIMVLDLSDRGKRYLDYLAIRTLHLYAGGCEGLSRFHTANNATHALAIHRYNLNIVLAVKWLKGSKCLGNFHALIPPALVALGS